MPINDSSDQLDLIGFLVLKYLIMKKYLILTLTTIGFYLILHPFWYIGFEKLFSICIILSLFFNKKLITNNHERI